MDPLAIVLFQTLIGRLATRPLLGVRPGALPFQTLIGRLATIAAVDLDKAVLKISNPHR